MAPSPQLRKSMNLGEPSPVFRRAENTARREPPHICIQGGSFHVPGSI